MVIAIMAVHRLSVHMEGQGNIAIRTGIYLTALATHDKAGITPAIEHEDDLLFSLQTFCYRFKQLGGIGSRFLLANIVPEIDHLYLWNASKRIGPLGQLKKFINPFSCTGPRFQARSRRPQDQNSLVVLSS